MRVGALGDVHAAHAGDGPVGAPAESLVGGGAQVVVGPAVGVVGLVDGEATLSAQTLFMELGGLQAGSGHDTSLRANLLTGRGDASWAVTRVQGVAGASTLHELTLASAVIVSPAGIQVGATVADSAAVLVPRRGFDGLKLVVDPRGERVAASSDRWGPPVLSDLLAYSPRELQLDVENLPPGRGLGIDRPLLLLVGDVSART